MQADTQTLVQAPEVDGRLRCGTVLHLYEIESDCRKENKWTNKSLI